MLILPGQERLDARAKLAMQDLKAIFPDGIVMAGSFEQEFITSHAWGANMSKILMHCFRADQQLLELMFQASASSMILAARTAGNTGEQSAGDPPPADTPTG